MLNHRVVITGRGAVSCYGLGLNNLFDNVWQGHSGVKVMEQWQAISGLTSFLAAPVPSFDAKKLLPRSLRRTMGGMAVNAALAAREAVAEAGLDEDYLHSGDIGTAFGSTTGSPEIYEQLYRTLLFDKSIEPIKSGEFFKIMGHSCSANVMYSLGLKGEQWGPSSACTSSAQAIGLGYLLVGGGRQEAMICGGADEVHHSVTTVFDVLQAASKQNDSPQSTPRPFDRDRDGVVCGGGAGALVLETLESARNRGAAILAEIVGFGHVGDPGHIAHPDPDAMARAMEKALSEAGLTGDEVDYVNGHATGTLQGDSAEAEAIARIMGSSTPVSSCKGHMGHTLGAAGALESILSIEMMQRGELVPTLNLDQPGDDCKNIDLLGELRPTTTNVIVKNSFAMGGVNVSIIFKRFG
ncbi:MAG: beta-ketoacyl synthase N-terminal-like domain-containing protein [Thermodesulfobacteriota bacterium]